MARFSYATCRQCEGARLGNRHCLAHLSNSEFVRVVKRLRAGTRLDARGVVISGSTIERLLRALESPHSKRAELPSVDFGGAQFPDDVDFKRAIFQGVARFSGARFSGNVRFVRNDFRGDTRFRGTRFIGQVRFQGAQFAQPAYFGDAKFESAVSFREVKWLDQTSFLRCCFLGPAGFADTHFAGNAKFNEAEFHAPTVFSRAHFERRADFFFAELMQSVDVREARFNGPARFGNTCFFSALNFAEAYFRKEAHFTGEFYGVCDFQKANFKDVASFGGARFRERCDFSRAAIAGLANFSGVRFDAPARFGGVTFGADAQFDGAAFGAGVRFSGSTFKGEARFSGSRCSEDARFKNAVFERTRALGPLEVDQSLFLDGAVFERHARVEAEAAFLSGRGANFTEGVYLKIRRASVILDDADFVRQSILAGEAQESEATPRLLSIRRAHVAPLVLSQIDLRSCRFFGAHGLESMRVEESCPWASVPKRWWLSQRQVIAEEHQWRVEAGGAGGAWHGAEIKWPEVPGEEEKHPSLTSPEVASIYRSLRKAREDAKDEAGAGDLYYGEMEMRRHSDRARSSLVARGESAILWTYWLISGYGLRASRALAALLVSLLMAAALFCWFGFQPEASRNFGRSFLFTVESSVSLLRAPQASLTVAGQVLQVIMRLTGPLLFGLALLAVRARVKR